LEDLCIRKLAQITGVKNLRDLIITKTTSTPLDLKNKFNCWQGAAFGLAPSFLQSVLFRPQIKRKGIEQLYLVGSSIHPGNGISIVMKGAKLTAQQIMIDITRQKDRCK
jgi:phytoene desaturase